MQEKCFLFFFLLGTVAALLLTEILSGVSLRV